MPRQPIRQRRRRRVPKSGRLSTLSNSTGRPAMQCVPLPSASCVNACQVSLKRPCKHTYIHHGLCDNARSHRESRKFARSRVNVLCDTMKNEQEDIRLDPYIAHLVLICEHRACLDQPLRESFTESFQNVGTHSGASATRSGVAEHEALKGVTAIGFGLNDVKSALVQTFSFRVPTAQLFPAPPPECESSWLQSFAYAECMIVLITRGSRTRSTARGAFCRSSAWQGKTSFLSIPAFENSLRADAMPGTQLLPKFEANLVAALAQLEA
ncbi:hypothetical protein HPB50_028548 [Hyalomma asiaticum]|nr:hypothetical protein HPB50_028548 [Hyalomma asiaticum]